MNELIFEKDKNTYLNYFSIDEKKFKKRRVLLAILFTVFSVALYFILEMNLLLWISVAMPIVGYKYPYFEVLKNARQDAVIKEYAFPTFLRYFISLLPTQGNVYQTLIATEIYTPNPIKKELNKLIKKIEDNPLESKDAYMDFSDYIGTAEAQMVMGMIHQFETIGIRKGDIEELESVINRIQENKTNALIERKLTSIDKHANPVLLYAFFYIFSFVLILVMAIFGEIDF